MTEEAAWRRRFRAPRVGFPLWARNAPDRLIYASTVTGVLEQFAWDRTTGHQRQVTSRPEGTVTAALDPEGRFIWWFDDERGNEFGRWMLEPFAGGESMLAAPVLEPAYGAGLALGHGFAVIGQSGDGGTVISIVHDSGDRRVLYRHQGSAWVGGLSRDESLVCIGHSEHGDSIHPALRVYRVDGSPVADLWDGPGLGLAVAGWSPVAGDNRLLVLHEREDARRPELWQPETGEITAVPVALPGEVFVSWYPDATALLVVHNHRGRSELFRRELATGSLTALPVEPGAITGARVRPDGTIWFGWSRSSTAAEVRELWPESGETRVLLRPEGDPAPGGAAYTDIEAGAVHGFLAEPPGPRPHPTVLWIHGGPSANDRDEFSPRIQALVDHGLAVALVNYRGSSGYGRAWRDALIGNPGLTELEDISAVRELLIRDGVADPARMAIGGGSWGGYLTLLALGTRPHDYAAGVAWVPVADYAAAYEDEMESLKAFDRALFGGAPDEIPEVYRERSPLTYIEQVCSPVLILAGENDPRCPIRQIDNYIKRLAELEKPHEVYRFNAGHGSLVIDEAIRHVEESVNFLARHLGSREAR